jgi:hypothetical protein
MKATTLTHRRSGRSMRAGPPGRPPDPDVAPPVEAGDDPSTHWEARSGVEHWRRGIGLTIAILVSLILWGLIALGVAMLVRLAQIPSA